jgi:hypothetical protein
MPFKKNNLNCTRELEEARHRLLAYSIYVKIIVCDY